MVAKVGDFKALRAELEEKVKELAKEFNVPGVAVGIYCAGQAEYVYHGVTSIVNPLPVDGKTLFQIGSTGKTFTATAMMRLVEQGKVKLDELVRTYVPELKLKEADVAKQVTVLQLMNHTAGWNGDVFDDTGDGDEALARYVELLATREQVSPLGSTFSYNNAAVALAGHVIEKVTGKTYEAAVKELVFEPLGLKDTLIFPNEVMVRRFAAGHIVRDDKLEVVTPWHMPRSSNPMGGISSTAPDQIKYAQFHLGDGRNADGEQVLTRASLDLMKQPTVEFNTGNKGEVGISWLMRDINGVHLVGHGGATVGQMSAFQTIPAEDFAITVLTNAAKGGELHGKLVKWALQAYVGVVEPDEPEPLPLNAAQLAEFAGTYSTEAVVVKISVDGDRLVINIEEQPEVVATLYKGVQPPPQPSRFAKILPGDVVLVVEGDGKGGKFRFLRDGEGAISAVNMGRIAKREK